MVLGRKREKVDGWLDGDEQVGHHQERKKLYLEGILKKDEVKAGVWI